MDMGDRVPTRGLRAGSNGAAYVRLPVRTFPPSKELMASRCRDQCSPLDVVLIRGSRVV
jgi:hypothetical protein